MGAVHEDIQSGPKVGIHFIVFNYCNSYCIPNFGPLCMQATFMIIFG